MPRQKAAIALAGIALILRVNAAPKSDLPTACAQFGEPCDHQRLCCGENLKCDRSNTVGNFECKEKAKLGDSCRRAFQCTDIVHSVCSKKKCTCRENNIKISDYACAPLLKAYCWKNETCVTENSMCIDNECQCRKGFLAVSNECLPAVLGSPCNDDVACDIVKSAICSTEKVCACSNNMIATNKRRCSASLGGTCQTGQDCGVANSWCDDNKCQCRGHYFANSNIECKLPYIGMPCKRSTDCLARIGNSNCIDQKCTCKPKYLPKNGNSCLSTTGLSCTTDDECLDTKFICIASRCQCKTNYVMRESECLPKQLTGQCSINSDCSEVEFAECAVGQCTCSNGFFTVNATTCLKALGGSCIVHQECSVNHSSCYDGLCQCSQGYSQYSESQCNAKELEMTCSDDSTCRLIKNADCFEGQCSCKDNHVEVDALTCAPLLNAICSDYQKCATENSVCIDHKCQCRVGYYQLSNYECVLRYLEQSCTIDKDCIDIRYAKCSGAGKCVCHKKYERTGPETCSPTLGGYCRNNKECNTVNAVCSRNQCRCSAGFMQQSDDLCLIVFLGQACDIDENCNKISNAECFDNKCICKPGYTKFDRLVCLPLIGENCVEHKECAVYNSNCVDNKCQCLETFVPQSQSQCMSTGLDEICYTENDCEIPNSHCSRFQFCVCNKNFISIEKKSCVQVLGAGCSESATCMAAHSDCIDSNCQCSHGFVQGPYNDCVPNLLGFFCRTDFDCKSVANANCIENICACKLNTFALTSSACTHLLSTDCSSSDDCGIKASHCFENKCQCKTNWVAISDMMCEKRSALYYCDNALDCGEPWHSKCFRNRCICNSNHISINSLTCLPILDGSCWKDDQCMTKNSHCIDFKCQCKPGFASVASNKCVVH